MKEELTVLSQPFRSATFKEYTGKVPFVLSLIKKEIWFRKLLKGRVTDRSYINRLRNTCND